MLAFKLKRTIGSSFPADGADVRAIKTALFEVGEYKPPFAETLGDEVTE